MRFLATLSLCLIAACGPSVKVIDISEWNLEDAVEGNPIPGWQSAPANVEVNYIAVKLSLEQSSLFKHDFWGGNTYTETWNCKESDGLSPSFTAPSFSSEYTTVKCLGEGCDWKERTYLQSVSHSNESTTPTIFLELGNGRLSLSRELEDPPGHMVREIVRAEPRDIYADICARLVSNRGFRRTSDVFVIDGNRIAEIVLDIAQRRGLSVNKNNLFEPYP